MKDFRTSPVKCLACGKEMDGAMGLDHDHAPTPGAISLCFYCGHLQAFDDAMQFRPLNDEEMNWAAGNKLILDAQKARRATMKMMKKGRK